MLVMIIRTMSTALDHEIFRKQKQKEKFYFFHYIILKLFPLFIITYYQFLDNQFFFIIKQALLNFLYKTILY